MDRNEFLKTTALGLASTFIPLQFYSMDKNNERETDEVFMAKLLEANEKYVANYLQSMDNPMAWQYYRRLSGGVAALSAGYCHPKSSNFRSPKVMEALDQIISRLNELQYPNGTLDSGGNRKSPPDTAFLLESLCPAYHILSSNEDFTELADVKKKLETFLLKAGEGLRTGGVHTPNHRWVISSVLAQLYAIFGDQKYLDRIDEWLAEGIYMNEDGQYPERSRNYSVVENSAFIHLGEILNRPELFENVSKNIDSTFYYMEADGELVALDSRRQDKYAPISITRFYRIYRFMAIHENSGFFAAIARKIEDLRDFNRIVLSSALPHFMANQMLSQEMPKSAKLPEDYTKHLKASNLVRIKRGDITASIFGGTDKPLTVASGRSTNPTFFTFRKGEAVLEYARLSSSFFSMGYFRSDGLRIEGNDYLLSEKKEAYYYHPLPASKRNKAGDYELTESLDGRFWSKMSFDERPKDTLEFNSEIKVTEDDGAFSIDLDITGEENVEVTLELCFRAGGVLEGVSKGYSDDDETDENEIDYFLNEGYATYSSGGDTIKVGPGKSEHMRVSRIDGEVYSTHFGSIKGKGMHLYITGLVPFKHTITIE
ncbi:hypothetical protein [Portibacter lacus]|uniref:Uncharacterized protein n=1 Tax=Portibacter lacus TaxID=1099794 RepID=A0AA37WHM1_9BACT|nr:hypothetical protein [Portibacter lacus]GLR19604.1 hypothetical protein GCM10007940_42200 [Portibacter lacus]